MRVNQRADRDASRDGHDSDGHWYARGPEPPGPGPKAEQRPGPEWTTSPPESWAGVVCSTAAAEARRERARQLSSQIVDIPFLHVMAELTCARLGLVATVTGTVRVRGSFTLDGRSAGDRRFISWRCR
jgi:hypothetical protein